MKSKTPNPIMWENNIRIFTFFAIYQSLFNQSIGLEFKISDYNFFLETLKDEYPDLFDKGKSEDYASKISHIMESFYSDVEDITNQTKVHLSDWSKTFGIVKAVLFCFILEKNFTANSEDFGNKSVGIYIKLAEEFTILANIKLIHAILSKLQKQD
jgi:transcription termination factor NusB